MKDAFIPFVGLVFMCMVIASACETKMLNARGEGHEKVPLSYRDALEQLHLNDLEADAFLTDDLFRKYDVIKKQYDDYAFASSLKAKIISIIVERETYPDQRIAFMLDELLQFQLPYPKESFMLLEEARNRAVLTPAEINTYGTLFLEKAMDHTNIWEHIVDCDTVQSENTMTADMYRGFSERASYTEKLKMYAPN